MLVAGPHEMRLRLAEIDAPESGQPFGRSSKQMLSNLVFGKVVEARVVDYDRYGRAVARVEVGGRDVNAEMVQMGGAWAYLAYLTDQRFITWQRSAQHARRGLWGLQADQIMPPWEWRKLKRAQAQRSKWSRTPYVARRSSSNADSQ